MLIFISCVSKVFVIESLNDQRYFANLTTSVKADKLSIKLSHLLDILHWSGTGKVTGMIT